MSKLSEAVSQARRLREIRTSLGEGKQARAASASPVRVRQARRALRLSQDAFASLVGVSRVTVANWEAGTTTPIEKHMDKIVEMITAAQLEDLPPELTPADIARLRAAWNCTRVAFAQSMETTPRNLARWESGRAKPSVISMCFLLDSWRLAASVGKLETLEELKAAQIKTAQLENNP